VLASEVAEVNREGILKGIFQLIKPRMILLKVVVSLYT
jgi:hypothetical protein